MVTLKAESLLDMTLTDLLPVLAEKAAAGRCPLCRKCDRRCEARARELLAPRAEAWAARWRQVELAEDLAGHIDHTLLKPEATPEQVEKLCREAAQYRFKSVCVNPRHVPLCARLLEGTGVLVCTVVGFPLGANSTAVKTFEARRAAAEGAREVDMVISIGELKAGANRAVRKDMGRVVRACHAKGVMCKVIIETALLEDTEKVRACRMAAAVGADFVKTSTGFSRAGATLYDVLLMRLTVGEEVGVKAAGGIRTLAGALKMLVAGANRLGASAGVELVEGARGMKREG